MKEIWREIDWNPRYLVSNLGRVGSYYNRHPPYQKTKVLRQKKLYKDHRGYFRVTLWNKQKTKKFLVHRLVGLAFIDNPQGKPFINHIDGVKTNNCVNNLEWCTPKENFDHARYVLNKNGMGLNSATSKLNREQVLYIYYSKKGCTTLARELNVCKKTVLNIRHKKTYKDVLGDI